MSKRNSNHLKDQRHDEKRARCGGESCESGYESGYESCDGSQERELNSAQQALFTYKGSPHARRNCPGMILARKLEEFIERDGDNKKAGLFRYSAFDNSQEDDEGLEDMLCEMLRTKEIVRCEDMKNALMTFSSWLQEPSGYQNPIFECLFLACFHKLHEVFDEILAKVHGCDEFHDFLENEIVGQVDSNNEEGVLCHLMKMRNQENHQSKTKLLDWLCHDFGGMEPEDISEVKGIVKTVRAKGSAHGVSIFHEGPDDEVCSQTANSSL